MTSKETLIAHPGAPANANVRLGSSELQATDESTSRHNRVRVIAQTAYPDVAPAPRVRIVELGRHLERSGIDLEFRPSLTAAEYSAISGSGTTPRNLRALTRGVVRSSRQPKPADDQLVLVHRLRSLLPTPGDGAPVDIYDFDDALHLESNLRHHFRLGALKRQSSRCLRYIRSARLVLAGNRILAGAAQEHATRVEIVPSCVDPRTQEKVVHGDREVLTLGWIGSATTSEYLRPILEVVSALYERGHAVRLCLMGAPTTLQAPWIEYRPWSLDGERRMLTEIDVGVMPLADDPWARGKCGYKLLRYFSAGLPTITSPVGVAADFVGDDRGFSARSNQEWSRAIVELGRDAAARREMGDRALDFVEREYSFEVWAPRVAELFHELSTR